LARHPIEAKTLETATETDMQFRKSVSSNPGSFGQTVKMFCINSINLIFPITLLKIAHTLITRNMKSVKLITLFCFIISALFSSEKTAAQNPENWTSKQLMQPAQLAEKITANKDIPVIFSVGPGATIPHSIDIGPGKEKENMDKLKKELSGLAVDTKVVVYCGCCPFEHCPNIRPAIDALKEMKFTNYQLLNLSHNLKTDWIDKGYPVSKQ
jgi:thiosulfate/3-mercaptopyruvate sulfurtransferase